jgi:hypothetical protein
VQVNKVLLSLHLNSPGLQTKPASPTSLHIFSSQIPEVQSELLLQVSPLTFKEIHFLLKRPKVVALHFPEAQSSSFEQLSPGCFKIEVEIALQTSEDP